MSNTDDEQIVNEDPIEGGYYGYEWPMLWPPALDLVTVTKGPLWVRLPRYLADLDG